MTPPTGAPCTFVTHFSRRRVGVITTARFQTIGVVWWTMSDSENSLQHRIEEWMVGQMPII